MMRVKCRSQSGVSKIECVELHFSCVFCFLNDCITTKKIAFKIDEFGRRIRVFESKIRNHKNKNLKKKSNVSKKTSFKARNLFAELLVKNNFLS